MCHCHRISLAAARVVARAAPIELDGIFVAMLPKAATALTEEQRRLLVEVAAAQQKLTESYQAGKLAETAEILHCRAPHSQVSSLSV